MPPRPGTLSFMSKPKVGVIGGGAAGYFAAIHCAESRRDVAVSILEGTARPLTKVKISGGGRCNVTHHCFDPEQLVRSYPRGFRELRGPFTRFQPKDTVAWFSHRGVELKVEADGRMFPITDDSETVIQCLQKAAAAAGVEVRLGTIVKSIERRDRGLAAILRNGEELFDRVLLASGSGPQGFTTAKNLGHAMIDPVPSLFTFNIKDSRLKELPGISFPDVELTLAPDGTGATFNQRGPLLITHWGLSGPAVLKLSAFAARELFTSSYKAKLQIQFFPGQTLANVSVKLLETRQMIPGLPRRFAQTLIEHVGIAANASWANLSRETLQLLAKEIAQGEYAVDGKGVFKEEFVTAGGVDLREVDFRTMQSKRCPGLYFAGEILDIDGITGGFNFQNAWTTGFLAGQGMAASFEPE